MVEDLYMSLHDRWVGVMTKYMSTILKGLQFLHHRLGGISLKEVVNDKNAPVLSL
jgi:hypothetical protein